MCASISVLERSDTVKINELSLRQRKILYILRDQTDYVPSKDLANALKVSTRTIRNDIHQMNQVLADYNAVVMSSNSKGFLFQAEDPDRTYIEEILPAKIALNMRYIKHQTLGEYMKIIFLTLAKIIR